MWVPARIFTTVEFDRFARKARIADAMLVAAIARAERGLVDADLGGNVVKLRIARPGEGRSGGFRTIVALLVEARAFYLFGFAKNDADNITSRALADFRAIAHELQTLPDGPLRHS